MEVITELSSWSPKTEVPTVLLTGTAMDVAATDVTLRCHENRDIQPANNDISGPYH
jgi:hypothetical protein